MLPSCAGNTQAVLVHQLSKHSTQNPFRKNRGRVVRVLFHPLKPFLFVATQNHVRVYNLAQQALAKKLIGGSGSITSMAIHPTGDHVIVGAEVRDPHAWIWSSCKWVEWQVCVDKTLQSMGFLLQLGHSPISHCCHVCPKLTFMICCVLHWHAAAAGCCCYKHTVFSRFMPSYSCWRGVSNHLGSCVSYNIHIDVTVQ